MPRGNWPFILQKHVSMRATTRGCWLWTGPAVSSGYGRVTIDGKTLGAHRAVWQYERGPIPQGMMLLHSCDNPACVNPDHLRVGTYADNVRDRSMRGRGKNQKIIPSDPIVMQIRAMFDSGYRGTWIAAKLNVSMKFVKDVIKYRKRWEDTYKDMKDTKD